MKFSRRRVDEPEINLIPFIDVLLVILIFLMLSTTYSRFTELQVTLPSADAEKSRDRSADILVTITSDGHAMVNKQEVDGRNVVALATELVAAAAGQKDAAVIISADALASHQSVINVLDAARRAGLARLTFATLGNGGNAP